MKLKMIIGFLILGLISIIIGVGIFFNALNAKPMYIKVYAGIIIAGGTVLLAYVNLSHDKNSSKKTDDILENTITTEGSVTILNNKADTSNIKIDLLKEENENLKSQIKDLDTNLSKKNKAILELTQQTVDLSMRLSEKAKSIYDINNTIKHPMPASINVSYFLYFKLDKKDLENADSILKSNYQLSLSNPGAYFGVEYELIKNIFDWNKYFSDWITVTFTKDFENFKKGLGYIPLVNFSNKKSLFNLNNSFQGIKKSYHLKSASKKFIRKTTLAFGSNLPKLV